MTDQIQHIRLREQGLENDSDHLNACHERWMISRNRVMESPEYQDQWGLEQCFNCKFYVALVGVFVEDYGACTNVLSPFDRQVMFEHDGCEHHDSADD
ncbi:MAG: DUF3027 domain-containing protein [Pyrinomonadaceae bacterium]